MSDLFARMIDRAAGRSPAVRTARPQIGTGVARMATQDAVPISAEGETQAAAEPASLASRTRSSHVVAQPEPIAIERSAERLVSPSHTVEPGAASQPLSAMQRELALPREPAL